MYEVFIGQDQQEQQGAYYTPLFLVDYILSETVEKKIQKDNNHNCKVLDPACGSGIFLVETLRKIIEKYQKNNPNYLNNTSKYKDDLKQLASNNIFGIDKDRSAINVAIFSIYLTLLDYQNPSDIENFKFPHLENRNFFSSDFFDTEAEFNEVIGNITFDFILGNPPWKRGKGKEKTPLFVQYIKGRRKKEKGKSDIEIEISNNEIAQAFVFRTSDFSSSNTKTSLIVTSKILYNLNAKKFRQYFLDNFFLNKVFELAPVRKEVFNNSNDKAVAPASVLFYQFAHNKRTYDNYDNIVKHISLKPSRFFSLFKVFTIQRGDYKEVSQQNLKDYDYLWKVLVYGSYLDFNLVKRLFLEMTSIKNEINKRDIIIKQGLKRKDGTKKIPVPTLVGIDFINTQRKELKPFYISSSKLKWTLPEVGYVYKKNGIPYIELFEPYSLLTTGGISSEFKSNSAINHKKRVFTSSVRAIKINNKSDLDFLYNINGAICSSLFSYYMLIVGSSAGIEREESEDEELLNFWFLSSKNIITEAKLIEKQRLKEEKQIFNLSGTKPYESNLDNIIFDEYALSSLEKDLINYATKISIPLIMKHKGYERIFSPLKSESETISEYVNLFFKRFNPVYKKNNQKLIVEVKHTNQIIGLFFKLKSLNSKEPLIKLTQEKNDNILKFLTSLGIEKITDRLFIQKDIRGFEKDGFYIIKPNERKLWHKAIGHLDVDEFMDAILMAGKKSKFNV